MYGTIFRMKLKAGQEQNVVDLFREWERDRKPKAKPESTEGRPWGQSLKKPSGAPLNLG